MARKRNFVATHKPTGKKYVWRYWRERFANSGWLWCMEDHEGYVRVYERTLINSMPDMLQTLSNYGMAHPPLT